MKWIVSKYYLIYLCYTVSTLWEYKMSLCRDQAGTKQLIKYVLSNYRAIKEEISNE